MRKAIVRHTRPIMLLSNFDKNPVVPATRGELMTALLRIKFGVTKVVSPRKYLIELYGLVIKDPLRHRDWDEAVSLMQKAYGRTSMVTVTIGTLGQHALACRGGRFNVEFFDPNKGEYRIPAKGFPDWFASLIEDGYGVTGRPDLETVTFKKGIVPRADRGVQRLDIGRSIEALTLLQKKGRSSNRMIAGGVDRGGYLSDDDLTKILDFYGGVDWKMSDTSNANLVACLAPVERRRLMALLMRHATDTSD